MVSRFAADAGAADAGAPGADPQTGADPRTGAASGGAQTGAASGGARAGAAPFGYGPQRRRPSTRKTSKDR